MKKTQFPRLMALFLAALFVVSPLLFPLIASAEETPSELTVTSTEAPTEKATEAPTEEVTEAPTEEATEAPTEETYPLVEDLGDEIKVGDTLLLAGDAADERLLSTYATVHIDALHQITLCKYGSLMRFRWHQFHHTDGGITYVTGEKTSYKYTSHLMYFDLGNGMTGYCLQPAKDDPSGNMNETGWEGFDEFMQRGVARALAYGAPNNGDTSAEGKYATSCIVWDIMTGYRDEYGNFTYDYDNGRRFSSTPFIDGLKNSATNMYAESKSKMIAAYNDILAQMQKHGTIPSFTAASESSITDNHTIKLEKDSSGNYSATCTDNNGVLDLFEFASPISGLTISQYGNTLSISATAEATQQISKRGGVIVTNKSAGHDISPSDLSVWYRPNSDGSPNRYAQKIASMKDNVNPMIAFFKITANSTAPFSLYKGINASQSCIDQIKDNAMYSLAGAEYEVLMDGVQQEVLITDASGYAASSKAYPVGTTLTIRETKAPSGFKLDKQTHSLTIQEGDNRIDVSDIPVFDPPFAITKVDKNTTTPQGNCSFYDAVFKWEYFDNTSWSGSPKRTWYFRTDSDGWSRYAPDFFAPGYNSDPLYVNSSGKYQIPIGTVTITEIVNPLGYLVVPIPLKCSIIADSSMDAKHIWTQDSLDYIVDALNGNFHIVEDIDTSLFGSLILDKIDSVSGAIPQGDSTLAGAKFEVVNNSTNAVQIDGFPKAAPGEICFEFTVDENGHFESGKIFPLGDYIVREAQAPDGHALNGDWSGSFSITKDNETATFTDANGCPDTPIYGGLQIIKQDADLGTATSADEPLDGIQFEIANDSANPVTVDGTSYANGETIMTLAITWDGAQWSASTGAADLPYGTYTVKEVEAKPGMANDYYQYDGTVHTVEVREQDVVVEANHSNPIAPGKIEIHKVDPQGQPLAGAKFCLEWSEDGSTWKPVVSSDALITKGGCTSPNLADGCLVSGEDGLVTYEGLYPTLHYRLTEVEAPDGYVLLTKPAFEGLLPLDDLTVTLTVHNSYGFTFPTAGSNTMQHLALIGTLITLISGAALVYPLHRRKQQS